MTTTERVQAVADYGFTERQARFLAYLESRTASERSNDVSQATVPGQ